MRPRVVAGRQQQEHASQNSRVDAPLEARAPVAPRSRAEPRRPRLVHPATMAAEAGCPSVHGHPQPRFLIRRICSPSPYTVRMYCGLRGSRLDLPADVLDVRVDGALEGVDVGAADRVEQLRAREDAARLACKRGEELEFGRRQVDRAWRCATPASAGKVDRRGRRAAARRRPRRRASTRRSTDRTRATSSRGLNGLVM